MAEIYVESWYINNGTASNSNTFNSAITGAGDIYFETWDADSAPAHNTYTFTGDMSNYGGDIRTSEMGGLSLVFSGSTRGSLITGGDQMTGTGGGVSGRGAIDTYANGINGTASAVTHAGCNATWDGVIVLNDADATLKFNHTAAHSREAAAGKITGDGSVEIVSTHGVTLNGDSDYAGGTTIKRDASLTLNSAGAAGSGVIKLNDSSTLTLAEGLTVNNEFSLTGSSTIGGNATLTGDITLEGTATLTATGTVNLAGNINADAGERLVLDSGNFNFTSPTVDASTLTINDSANVTLANASTLTSMSISAPENLSFTTTEGGTSNVDVYTLGNIDKLIMGATGELALDLGNLTDFNALEITAFKVDGLTEGLGYWYGNLSLIINGTRYQVKGATNSGLAGDSSLVLYIPEPSTATMSLLALAGLLMRRRRKAA